jgi:hypothetical protein
MPDRRDEHEHDKCDYTESIFIGLSRSVRGAGGRSA